MPNYTFLNRRTKRTSTVNAETAVQAIQALSIYPWVFELQDGTMQDFDEVDAWSAQAKKANAERSV